MGGARGYVSGRTGDGRRSISTRPPPRLLDNRAIALEYDTGTLASCPSWYDSHAVVPLHQKTMTSSAEEVEQAAAALAESRRRTEALAVYSRRMAHDLSNFLTVIRTYSELLLSDLPSDHGSRPDVEEIAQAADTTVAYVQRASSFARAASAKPAAIEVDALVADVIANEGAAGVGPIIVDAACERRVMGSSALLAEALHEILQNAREASPPAAPVRVATRTIALAEPRVDSGVPVEAGHWAVIEVQDQGTGVDADIMENVFDPFVTTKSGVRGAGFGLATARSVAWACGGQLALGREGNVTIARLYLPVLAERS